MQSLKFCKSVMFGTPQCPCIPTKKLKKVMSCLCLVRLGGCRTISADSAFWECGIEKSMKVESPCNGHMLQCVTIEMQYHPLLKYLPERWTRRESVRVYFIVSEDQMPEFMQIVDFLKVYFFTNPFCGATKYRILKSRHSYKMTFLQVSSTFGIL